MAASLQDTAAGVMPATILIVDDNPISRLFIEKTLRGEGYTQLLLASNGYEALEAVRLHQPAMVILDIVMPQMDGFECCAAIRAQAGASDIPILIQTAITEPSLRVRAFAHGATDFISKPVYPLELVARVRVHLEKQRALMVLQEYRDRTADQLDRARQLQQSMLPGTVAIEQLQRSHRLDLAAIVQPSHELGGDFWGIRALDTQRVAMWIADLSGHGLPSALHAMRLQALLREPSAFDVDPGAYLSALNEIWLKLNVRGQFATVFYAVLDVQQHQLAYASACTPNPIVQHAASPIAQLLDGAGMPLGIRRQRYPTHQVPFAPGDALLLYSDALMETPAADGRCLSEGDLADALQGCRHAPANQLLGAVWGRFEAHRNRPADDDLTLLVIRREDSEQAHAAD